jgi:hypothetical protein
VGVRVTQAAGLATPQTSVTTLFIARMPSGRWTPIFRDDQREDGTKARPEEKAIATDPQVQKAMQWVRDFGLPVGAGDAAVAVRAGAAVAAALERSDARFDEFVQVYAHHLEGPPLYLSAGEPGASRTGGRGQ